MGILVASNGMVFNRIRGSQTRKWTFGHPGANGRYDVVQVSGKQYRVHRLVAETFLPNPEGKIQVDHILRDTHDNNVCQIKWSTPTENNRNKSNNTGIAELWTTDRNLYRKIWHSMHVEKIREKHRGKYWEKREAGFHYVRGADGKKHWEKIKTEDSPNPRVAKNLVRASLGTV